MRIFILVFVLAAFCSCDDKITQEDLEGTWEHNTPFPVHLIFNEDSLWIHYPITKDLGNPEAKRRLDSMSLAHNHYKYTLSGDTIKLNFNWNVIRGGTDHIEPRALIISKLSGDSLIILDGTNEDAYIRIQ